MDKKEFIKRTVQIESNAFIYQGGAQEEAAAINPNIWDTQLRDFEEKSLVITPLAEVYDFRGGGVDYKVTVDEIPSAAGALVETTDVSIQAFTTRNVTFVPTEQGTAFQLTRQEAVRAFFNVAERMVRKLGYALAERKDSLALTEVYASAGNAIIANSVANITALASTDTLNIRDISRAMYEIRTDYYRTDGGALVVNPHQEHQLRTQSTLITLADASQFGTRQVLDKGMVGSLLGLKVYVSDLITATSSVAKAFIVGVSKTGEKPFGYAVKRDPIIEREYHARGRYWDIVAHEEYDFATLHPNAICTISTYSA